MTTVAEAFVTIRPDMDGFGREVEGGVSRQMGGGAGGATGGAFAGAMKTVGKTGALALVAGMGASLTGGFKRLSSLEDFGQMLDAVQVSTDDQAVLTDELNNILTGTPFALDAGAQAMLGFITAGEDLERVPGLFEQVVDAAAFGKAPMEEVSTIWQRIGLQGRATNEELRMLTNRNIPVYALLADALGITADEVRELASSGELSSDIFFDAWEEGAQGFGDDNIKIAGAAQAMGDTTRGALANMGTAFSRLGARVLEPFFGGFQGGASGITDMVNRLGDVLEPMAQWLGEKIPAAFNAFIESETFSQLKEIAMVVVDGMRTSFEQFMEWAVPFWEEHGEDIMRVITVAFENLVAIIGGALTVIQGVIEVFVALATGDMELFSTGVRRIFSGLGSFLMVAVSGFMNFVLAFFNTSLEEIVTKFATTAATVLIGVQRWGRNLVSTVTGFLSDIVDWFRGLPDRIISALGNVAERLREAGRNMMEGLLGGITSKGNAVTSAVSSVASNTVGTAQRILGISSPSRVFEEIGEQSVEGFMLGLNSMSARQVMPALNDLTAGQSTPRLSGGPRGGLVINGNVTVGSRDDLGQLGHTVRKMAVQAAYG